MVKVSIEVRSGAARFYVALRAHSFQRAISFVQERYSKGTLKVKSPMEPEGFFVEDPTAAGRMGGLEDGVRVAA
jgi:hypothetical protein